MHFVVLIFNNKVKTGFPESSKKRYCEFIVNVNTSAEKKSPHFSLTSVCQITNLENNKDFTYQAESSKKSENSKQLAKNYANKRNNMNDEESETKVDDDDLMEGKDNYLIALKTEKTIAIIQQSRGSAKLLGTMDISDKFIQKKNICFHAFVYSQIQENSQLMDSINQLQTKSANSSQRQSLYQNTEQTAATGSYTVSQFVPESPDIYICFQTGYILVMNSLTSHFLYNFNISNEKADNAWHQKRITKICTMPDQKSFLVLFSDSVIMQYSLNSKSENHAFQEEITKQLDQVSFQPKKFGTSIQRKSYGTYQYSSISDKDFLGFACYYNDEETHCGPHKFFKFKCPSISDFAILPQTHPLYKLVNGKYSREPLLIAFSGLDGLFRVVDVINFQAVYCFKSYYGGFNSFSFEKGFINSPIVSLACQDDSIIILNTRLNTYTRIIGHISFVSYSIFTSITPNIIRVTGGSYDGQVSITEVLRNEIDNPDKEDVNAEQYLPIKIKYQSNVAEVKNVNHMQKMNEEGIAYVLGFQDYFLTSAFDGCASLFKYQEQMPESMQQQVNENEGHQEGQQNQQEQQQNDHNRNSHYSQNNQYSQSKSQSQRKDSSGQYNNQMRRQEEYQQQQQQYNNNSQYKGGQKSTKQQYQQQSNNNNNNNNNNAMENEDDEQHNRGDEGRNQSSYSNYKQQQRQQQEQDQQQNYQKRDKRQTQDRNYQN